MVNCVEKEENGQEHDSNVTIDLNTIKDDYEFIYNCYYNYRLNSTSCSEICKNYDFFEY